MNLFAKENRLNLGLAAVTLSAAIAAATPANASLDPSITSSSQLSTYEEIINPDARYLYTNVTHSHNGAGELHYHYSAIPQLTPVNNAAYVDPASGLMRAYAFSDAADNISVAVEPPFNLGPESGRAGAGSSVSYQKQLEVASGNSNLPEGAPVRLTLTFHLDGRLAVGSPLTSDPGPMYSSASMTARFSISDQAVPTEDDSIYQLVNFSASAQRTQYVLVPGSSSYPDGAQIATKNYHWTLDSNDPNEAERNFYDPDYQEYGYNFGTGSGSEIPPSFVPDFSTGTLVVAFDTYIGATLDINALLQVSTSSDALSYSPYASANFMNTFALEFAPAEGFEGISILSNASVPEPGSLTLLVASIPLVCRRRSR